MRGSNTNVSLINNQQKIQLNKGVQNSFAKNQFNSPLSNTSLGSKSPTTWNQYQFSSSPNQLAYLSSSGKDQISRNSITSIQKSPKQVTFSDEQNNRFQKNQEIITPYNLREARGKQQTQTEQQQTFSDKIRIEENSLPQDKEKPILSLIQKQQSPQHNQFQVSNKEQNLLTQNNSILNQNRQGYSSPYYLQQNKLIERNVITEETEEDSDQKVQNNSQDNRENTDENIIHSEEMRQNCMNQDYMEFKNQQQSLFKLPNLQDEADKINRIQNVIVENKKISIIKNSIKNRLEELERKIELEKKTDGQVHQELDQIDHNQEDSVSELDEMSNNSKSIRSLSQKGDADNSKNISRQQNNEENNNSLSIIQQQTTKTEIQNGKAALNLYFKTQKQSQSGFQSYQNFENKSKDNLGSFPRDDQSNFSALVRDFSNIADNKRINDSSYQNQQQQSFSIATDYKKQYLQLSESITPSQQIIDCFDNSNNPNILPQSISTTQQILTSVQPDKVFQPISKPQSSTTFQPTSITLPTLSTQPTILNQPSHTHNFSFRDKNIKENDRFAGNFRKYNEILQQQSDEQLKNESIRAQTHKTMNRYELETLNNSQYSKYSNSNASLNKSSSELQHILIDELSRSLSKHKQLNQIKDQITIELEKQKQRQNSQQGNSRILDSLLQQNMNQQNNLSINNQIQINSNITDSLHSFEQNRKNTSELFNRSNYQQSDNKNYQPLISEYEQNNIIKYNSNQQKDSFNQGQCDSLSDYLIRQQNNMKQNLSTNQNNLNSYEKQNMRLSRQDQFNINRQNQNNRQDQANNLYSSLEKRDYNLYQQNNIKQDQQIIKNLNLSNINKDESNKNFDSIKRKSIDDQSMKQQINQKNQINKNQTELLNLSQQNELNSINNEQQNITKIDQLNPNKGLQQDEINKNNFKLSEESQINKNRTEQQKIENKDQNQFLRNQINQATSNQDQQYRINLDNHSCLEQVQSSVKNNNIINLSNSSFQKQDTEIKNIPSQQISFLKEITPHSNSSRNIQQNSRVHSETNKSPNFPNLAFDKDDQNQSQRSFQNSQTSHDIFDDKDKVNQNNHPDLKQNIIKNNIKYKHEEQNNSKQLANDLIETQKIKIEKLIEENNIRRKSIDENNINKNQIVSNEPLSENQQSNKSKCRLKVKTLADYHVDQSGENMKYLEKETGKFQKRFSEIKKDIDEKEATVKLHNKITECINIYQNEKRNEQQLQFSRQKSPMSQSNAFSNSMRNQSFGFLSQQFNQSLSQIPSQLDINKMANLSYSTGFTSSNQRSASQSKKRVRFLSPQEEKEFVSSIERTKKSKFQQKMNKLIKQKVYGLINKLNQNEQIDTSFQNKSCRNLNNQSQNASKNNTKFSAKK